MIMTVHKFRKISSQFFEFMYLCFKLSFNMYFIKFLREKHVGTAIHYPLPIHRQPFWRAKGWNQEGLPTTDKLSSQIVSLPIDPFLSNKEQNKVIETVKKFFEEK